MRTPLRDWLVLAGQAVPALILWGALAQMPGSAFAPEYRFPAAPLLALESPFLFRGATGGIDTGVLATIFCIMALYLAVRNGWLTWPRTLAGPALVLLVLALALPFSAFGVAFIDYRFSVAAACLALAGLRLTPPALKFALPLAAVVTLLTVVHVVDVAVLMHRCDGQYAELRSALASLPRGAVLTTVEERTEPAPGATCTALPIYEHMGPTGDDRPVRLRARLLRGVSPPWPLAMADHPILIPRPLRHSQPHQQQATCSGSTLVGPVLSRPVSCCFGTAASLTFGPHHDV